MDQYKALAVYTGLLFIVFVAGIAWSRYRKLVVRRFNLSEYRHNGSTRRHPA
jgi:hypothetical protein